MQLSSVQCWVMAEAHLVRCAIGVLLHSHKTHVVKRTISALTHMACIVKQVRHIAHETQRIAASPLVARHALS